MRKEVRNLEIGFRPDTDISAAERMRATITKEQEEAIIQAIAITASSHATHNVTVGCNIQLMDEDGNEVKEVALGYMAIKVYPKAIHLYAEGKYDSHDQWESDAFSLSDFVEITE